MPLRSIIAIPGLLAVAACGSGASDGTHGQTTPPPDPLSFAESEAARAALHATWDIVALTDPATLPLSGSADYDGIIRLDVQQGAGEISMDGALSLRANFSAATISGSATGFADENEAGYAGTLTLANGQIDRLANVNVDYTYTADLAGTLTGAGESYDVTADLSGDFISSTWGAVTGAVSGNAQSSFGNGYVFGSFIGQR